MSVSTSPITIVPRSRGRIAIVDAEASTPAGRALHWVESVVMDAAHSLVRLFESHERESLIDADCDARVNSAIAALEASCADARAYMGRPAMTPPTVPAPQQREERSA